MFVFAMTAFAAVAAYAGDVANPNCDWTTSGWACEGGSIVAASEGAGTFVRSKV